MISHPATMRALTCYFSPTLCFPTLLLDKVIRNATVRSVSLYCLIPLFFFVDSPAHRSKLSTLSQSVARASESQSAARTRGPVGNASTASRAGLPISPTTGLASAGPLMTVGSNGPHGAAPSGNGTVPFNGLSMAPRRGKDGNATMTLFVRNTGSTTPGAASGTPSALLTDKDPGPDFGLAPDAGDAADDSNGTDVVEAVGNALSAAVDTVTDSIPAIRRAAQRPSSIVAGVFFYFVLVIVYMLFEARHIIGVELALQSLRNDRLISMSSSVTEQLLAKNTALNKARQTGNVSEVELIALEEEVSVLDERRLTLLKKMAQQMAYSGPVDDIQFLIEEHVAYEELVKSVGAQETEWARDGEALKRSIESRRLDVDERGRPINELALDFDRFLYGLAINKWEAERLAQNTTASESTVGISPIMSSAESFISFDEEIKTKSQWMRDTISRIRNNRVLALAFVSILAVVYFRFA